MCHHKKFAVSFDNADLQILRDVTVIGILHRERQAVFSVPQIADPIVVHHLIRDAILRGFSFSPYGGGSSGLFLLSGIPVPFVPSLQALLPPAQWWNTDSSF